MPLGPDVLGTQLRVPTRSLGPSGRGPGTTHVAEGYEWVVDIDLEKFFDRVNHDILMDRVAKRITDKRLLRLIRAYLNAGVMADGLVSPTDEGVPQGGPLSTLTFESRPRRIRPRVDPPGSPLLPLCRRLQHLRGQPPIGGARHGQRCRFLTTRLQLKVNESKSAVARSGERKFLGFTISNEAEPTRQIAAKALQKFKERIRELTSRTLGVSLPQLIAPLARYLIGWRGYFGFCQTPRVLRGPGLLDSSPITHVYLASMEERPDSVRAIAPSGCVPLPRGGCRRLGVWVLAHGSPCDGAAGPVQRLFRLARPSSGGGLANRLTRSNRRGTDPYARWCGRGGAARLPPIPINVL